jgi:glycosyltransferase involved in cell wall biosynthesis
MTSPDRSETPPQQALARLPDPLRRHLEGVVLPLCGWDPGDAGPEMLPKLGKKRLAFCRKNLFRGGSARVMIEQMAALGPTGAAMDVFTFEDGTDPAVTAEIRARCPSVRRVRRVSRRLASTRSLVLETWPGRHDLFLSTDILDPMIFAATVRKFRLMRPPRVAAMLHEAYDRYLEFLRPQAKRISAFCLDYDFRDRFRAVFGPDAAAGIVAPLFPLGPGGPVPGGSLRRDLGIPEAGQVLAYAGRLDRNKQIERLADVLEDLLAEGRDRVWLLLAGRWEDEAYRREVAARFDRETTTPAGRRIRLSERIREAGVVPSLDPVLAAADVFVFASRVEGFYPLVVMEAQRAGLPVVCTGVGGLGRVILDGVTGCLAPVNQGSAGADFGPDTRRVFVERVRMLLDDPAARRRLGEAGREVVAFLTTHYPFARLFRRWVAGVLEATGAP